jgi:signal transduction histidine kinase
MQNGARIIAGILLLAGVVSFILAPFIGDELFSRLWGVEPLTYIGAVLVILGLTVVSLSYEVPGLIPRTGSTQSDDRQHAERWTKTTQQYFDLFDHDLGRPLRRILGKERELRTLLRSAGGTLDPAVEELLDEIERQTPNFRLMLSNIRVLVELEAPGSTPQPQAVEPSQIVRNIVERYSSQADAQKEVTWWSEPPEFGIVHSDSSAIEHIVTNLVDNGVRFATARVEVRISKNPTHFFVRVWDDGQGIAAQYLQHIFERGWTPEVARREEKPSSGLGLHIARTIARRYGGDVTVESVTVPSSEHHTAFLLSLPLGEPGVTHR